MTISEAPSVDGPVADWESEGGAFELMARREAEADPWRTLMTLSAMITVWRDLPVGVRRRIASDAVDAMNWVEPYYDPCSRAAPPSRSAATPRH